MTYAYDRDAMAQPSTLDPFRVATTLAFQHTHDDDDVMIEASTLTLTGPRGADEFARMWAAYRARGERSTRLDSILALDLGGVWGNATDRDGIKIAVQHGTPAARQMFSILRWLLACGGYGEDVLMDAVLAALEAGSATVGNVMAHAPLAIETRDWSRREPARSSTPFEWLE